jgi:hypothetical protein
MDLARRNNEKEEWPQRTQKKQTIESEIEIAN